MDELATMTLRQWAIAVGLFIFGGWAGMAIIFFLPIVIFAWPLLIALFVFEMAMHGLLWGFIYIILWPFRRNKPKKKPEKPEKPQRNPWPIRYAFVVGFLLIGGLTWMSSDVGMWMFT